MDKANVFELVSKALYEFGEAYINATYDDSCDDDKIDEETMEVVDGFALELMAFFEQYWKDGQKEGYGGDVE